MQIIHIQTGPYEVDFYFENIKISSVVNANVIFWPESADIMNSWSPKKLSYLANEMAPWIAKMLTK